MRPNRRWQPHLARLRNRGKFRRAGNEARWLSLTRCRHLLDSGLQAAELQLAGFSNDNLRPTSSLGCRWRVSAFHSSARPPLGAVHPHIVGAIARRATRVACRKNGAKQRFVILLGLPEKRCDAAHGDAAVRPLRLFRRDLQVLFAIALCGEIFGRYRELLGQGDGNGLGTAVRER